MIANFSRVYEKHYLKKKFSIFVKINQLFLRLYFFIMRNVSPSPKNHAFTKSQKIAIKSGNFQKMKIQKKPKKKCFVPFSLALQVPNLKKSRDST